MTFHFWSWHSCHSFRSELHASNGRTMAPVIHPISNINIINGEYIKIAPTSSNVDISCMQTIDIIASAQRVTSTCGFVVFHIFFFFCSVLARSASVVAVHAVILCIQFFFCFSVFIASRLCARYARVGNWRHRVDTHTAQFSSAVMEDILHFCLTNFNLNGWLLAKERHTIIHHYLLCG